MWLDLPTEIVERVLVYLDPQSLLSMGKVDRFLNHLALKEFFGSSIHHIQVNKLIPPYPHPESLILSGLCLALWLDNIIELDQRIVGDLQQSIWQFRKLITFVERLHTLKSLTLRVSIIPPYWRCRGYRAEGDLLVGKLHQLLEIAVNKGCEKLHIEGNSIPHCRLSSAAIRTLRLNFASTAKTWKWMKRRILHPCVQKSACLSLEPSPETIYPAIPPDDSPSPHVTECVLRKPALLGTTALPYIVNLLRRNADTITHLDMNCYGLTRSYYKARALSLALFNNIHLPRLDTLVLTFQVSTISTNSFAWFLSRHPKISVLKINDPSTLPQQPPLIPVKRYPFHLPNLKTLDLPSRVIEWFFSSAIQLPEALESVTIHASNGTDNLESLGNAIRDLRHWMGYIESLALDTNWWSYGMARDHGHDRLGRQDVVCSLQVRKLVFLVGERPFYTTMCPRRLAGYFMFVVKVFPTLAELEIKSRNLEQLQGGEEMREVILTGCPNLIVSVQC
jgi:hypothetical protein